MCVCDQKIVTVFQLRVRYGEVEGWGEREGGGGEKERKEEGKGEEGYAREWKEGESEGEMC